jgi:hypothetical protein
MTPRCPSPAVDVARWTLACTFALAFGAARALPVSDPNGDPTGAQAFALACAGNAVVSLATAPATVNLGQATTVSWSVKLPANCSAYNKVSLNSSAVALSGSKAYMPEADSTSTLTLAIPGGYATLGQAAVHVILPPTIVLNGGSPLAGRSTLLQALREGGHVVQLGDGVDMDMSYLANQPIAANTRIIGTRGSQRLGARLSTTTHPEPLFEVVGDNVQLQGFRLQGPDFGLAEGGGTLERAVSIDSHTGIDIGNMEFSGWGGTAVDVKDNADRLSRFATNGVTIHDSFFHHNQHEGGNGYGVSVNYGAHATITQNVFDFDRHAIAGDGRPGTGYTARRNLVLKGNGLHRCVLGVCVHTHAFDMHAREHCGFWHGLSVAFEWLPGVDEATVYNCGAAGEFMEIADNAFQFVAGPAFKLRGTPSAGASVLHNVFAHDSLDDAVQQNETGLVVGLGPNANRTGYDSFGRYGVCDFDGDGKDDLFLATGVSWWYMSSARMHWVFLRSATETMDQLALGRFTGPGKCDVFAVHGASWDVSRGGTQAWESLGAFNVPFAELRFGDFNGDGITDMFRRGPQGDWSVVSPGRFGWQALAGSSQALGDLAFGDFDHDGRTDVLGRNGGQWAISSGGVSSWVTLNPNIGTSPAGILVADIDGNGMADALRYVQVDPVNGRWEISWDGRGPWQTLAALAWPSALAPLNPAGSVRGFVGKFSDGKTAELLSVDYTRMGQIYSRSAARLVPWGLYAY